MKVRNFSFPLECRLTEKHSFTNVFSKPAFTKNTAFFSILATTSTLAHSRLGVVIAKRNVRLAVDRNKLKRLVRETFRLQQHLLCGLDVVVIVRKDFAAQVNERNKLSSILARIVGDAKKVSNF